MAVNIFSEYRKLLNEFGDPTYYWPQWCAPKKDIIEREKIIIGMILVQRTSWHNANIALKNLRDEGLLSIKAITNLSDLTRLTELIRPAGFFQSKPGRLHDMCNFVLRSGGIEGLISQGALSTREALLQLKGVGKETADTILLYALDKPCFIIDEYTYRWLDLIGVLHSRKYDDCQKLFLDELPSEVELFQKLHALIIISQRGRERSLMEIV